MASKLEIIKIKLSSTFVCKANCKYCGNKPQYYSYVRDKFLFKDQGYTKSIYLDVVKSIQRLSSDWIYYGDPGIYTRMSDLTFKPNQTKYNPRTHSSHKNNPMYSILEFLSCECGKTSWCFNQKASVKKMEISNRKSKNFHKNTFTY